MKKLIMTILGTLGLLSLVGCKGDSYQCEYVLHALNQEKAVVVAMSRIAKDYGFTLRVNDSTGIAYLKMKDDKAPAGFQGIQGSSGLTIIIAYSKQRHAIVISQDYKNVESEFLTSIKQKIEAALDELVGKENYGKAERTFSKSPLA